MEIDAKFPNLMEFLFQPKRYKVARGGRGSAKSWSFARALLILGLQRKMRILCAREVQLSIKQSVHKLLKDQIDLMHMGEFYRVYDTDIRGVNGTEFSFTGLSQLTVSTIKSFEGVDICWVEEGQVISKRSWDILIPTIRKTGSEIWISYNPELETDETHQRFTINQPPDCINVEINWRDNPWFTDVLEKERQYCKLNFPEDYNHIWEGKCLPAVSGAIYFRQIQDSESQGRICNVPHDPMLRTHIVLDLGWEDSLATALIQRHLSEIRFIEYLEFSHTEWVSWSAELKTRPYNWGRVWLPAADGFAKTLNAQGKSAYDILTGLGWDCAPQSEVTAMSVEEGIRATRLAFPQMYFDSSKCAAKKSPDSTDFVNHTEYSHRLIECLKRYRRYLNRQTDAAGSPAKDAAAHGADCTRYVAINYQSMGNEQDRAPIVMRPPRFRQRQDGWMM